MDPYVRPTHSYTVEHDKRCRKYIELQIAAPEHSYNKMREFTRNPKAHPLNIFEPLHDRNGSLVYVPTRKAFSTIVKRPHCSLCRIALQRTKRTTHALRPAAGMYSGARQ